jgi:hypothetical protein
MDITSNSSLGFSSYLTAAQVADRAGSSLTSNPTGASSLSYSQVANQINPAPIAADALVLNATTVDPISAMFEQVYRAPLVSNRFFIGSPNERGMNQETQLAVKALTSVDQTRSYASGQNLNPNAYNIQQPAMAMAAYNLQIGSGALNRSLLNESEGSMIQPSLDTMA